MRSGRGDEKWVSAEAMGSRVFAGVTQLVESQPSKLLVAGSSPVSRSGTACVAQLVEHILGKDEVIGSIPIASSASCISINFLLTE